MTDTTKERALADLAKQMADEGYCNYAACQEYLAKAYRMGAEQSIPATNWESGRDAVVNHAYFCGLITEEVRGKMLSLKYPGAERSTPANWEGRAEIAKLKQENAGLRERLAAEPATETPPSDELEKIRQTLFSALEMKEPSLDKCDRSAFELAMIASNGIFWRNRTIAELRKQMTEAPHPIGTPEHCPSCGNGKYARGCVATRKGHALTHIPNTCDCVPCTDTWHDGPVGTPPKSQWYCSICDYVFTGQDGIHPSFCPNDGTWLVMRPVGTPEDKNGKL